MAADSKEPTPAEVFEAINKCKDEIIKQAEKSRLTLWITVAGFGATVGIFGASLIAQTNYESGIPIAALGFGFMLWARSKAIDRTRKYTVKWNEKPLF